MSRSGLAVALLCLHALTLHAQEAAQWREATRLAEAEYRAVRDSMLQGDSTVREVARSGDLVVAASDDLRRIAQSALDRVALARKRWFGGRLPSEGGFRIVISQQTEDPTRPHSMVVLSGLPDSGQASRMDRTVRRDQIEATLVDVFGEMMIAALPPAIRKWLDGAVSLSMPEPERRHFAMYAMATGTGLSQRACLSGSVLDCLYALGLGSPPRNEPGGAYAAYLRGDLLLTTLELQPEAWDRLRMSNASEPSVALVQAAGLTADSLIDHWLRVTTLSRPRAGLLGAGMALTVLVWIGLTFMGALLGGKSRWV
jgi:hypothetical protein